MKTVMLGMLAETPVHVGSGRSLGVVDLPVAREAATDYPVLPGSGLKGALRDLAEQKHDDRVDKVFGTQERAGEVLVSDGRLLLLPVRSLSGAYRWATCPHLLERFLRDGKRFGAGADFTIPKLARRKVLSTGGGILYLEERQFEITGVTPPDVIEAVGRLISDEDARKRLDERIAILHDDDFAWFARYGLQVQARNILEDGTKKSTNLWYEETLPSDAVMYSLLTGRSIESLTILDQLFPEGGAYFQVGGNETVGHGWFSVRILKNSGRGGAR